MTDSAALDDVEELLAVSAAGFWVGSCDGVLRSGTADHARGYYPQAVRAYCALHYGAHDRSTRRAAVESALWQRVEALFAKAALAATGIPAAASAAAECIIPG